MKKGKPPRHLNLARGAAKKTENLVKAATADVTRVGYFKDGANAMFVAGLQVEIGEFEAPALGMNPNNQPNRVGGDIKQINVQGQSRRRVLEELGDRFAAFIADQLLLEREHARAELEETADIKNMKVPGDRQEQ